MPPMSPRERGLCSSAGWNALSRSVISRWALAGERPTGEILEIGGGAGAMAEAVLERSQNARLTCTDPDPAMVGLAEQRLAPYGDRGRAAVADATALDHDDDSFDWVLSFLMLHHVLDWERALEEAVRVLRPGGVLAGYDLTDHPLVRVGHTFDDSPILLIGLAELEDKMFELGGSCVLRPLPGGIGVRFKLRTPVT